ncbi:MAG TPA: hypothetical protein VNE39_01965 [Planctomycetota bacterium]|nr:hypothetical protein [Planctomycetota bacterium]
MNDAEPSLPLTPNTVPFRAVATLVVAIGLFSQVAQIVMFREMLATCRGTEVLFGVVLAAGLLWTALGSVVAGLFARCEGRRLGARWPARAWASAAALFALNGLLLIGQIAIARHRSAAWGGAAELTFLEAVATAILATGPVAFVSGLEFVLALHALRAEDFARLYQADAWGAVAGGLLFTFALVGLVDPVTLGPALTAGLCLLVLAAGGRRWMPTGVVIGLAATVAVAASGLDGRLHARRWAALYPGFKLCATQDSRYGQLAVLEHPSEEQYSFYVDGGLVETLEPANPNITDERNRALVALAQHPAPERVLLVGRALGRLPDALLLHGLKHLDVLELDPSLIELAIRFSGPPMFLLELDPSFPGSARGSSGPPVLDERLRVHFADARRFIKQHAGAGYDVILLCLPDPLSAFVNRFYTVEFFREARAAMSEQGVLITSVTAAATYAGETVGQLSASLLRTLQAVFPEVLVAPGESHTFTAAAKPGTVSLDPAVLGRRIARRGIPLDVVSPNERLTYATALFENLITASQTDSLRLTLEGIKAPLNTDARPITYQLALQVWNQIVSASTEAQDPGTRGGTNALFRAALSFRFAHGLVLPALVLTPGLLLFVLARRRGGAARGAGGYGLLVVAAATGLFGMASEIILIYAFQNTYGYAYAEVGLLVAAFMVGLALGARAGRCWETRARILMAIVGAMVAYCLLLPLALGELSEAGASPLVYAGFLCLVLGAGFLDGATFPPLVQALRQQGFGRAGGWVYAADLAGSGIGALLTGALLVPVIGQSLALVLVAITLAAALAALGLGTMRPLAASNKAG